MKRWALAVALNLLALIVGIYLMYGQPSQPRAIELTEYIRDAKPVPASRPVVDPQPAETL